MYTKDTHPHIAIDFDETIAEDLFPHIGEVREGAVETIKALLDTGYPCTYMDSPWWLLRRARNDTRATHPEGTYKTMVLIQIILRLTNTSSII